MIPGRNLYSPRIKRHGSICGPDPVHSAGGGEESSNDSRSSLVGQSLFYLIIRLPNYYYPNRIRQLVSICGCRASAGTGEIMLEIRSLALKN